MRMTTTTLSSLADKLTRHLTDGALPAELHAFGKTQQKEAAAFVAATAETRKAGKQRLAIETLPGDAASTRRLRPALLHADIPLLPASMDATNNAPDTATHTSEERRV